MTALSLDGISKSYGTARVLDDVALDVESGAFVALLGASGSGKSTLLRIIAGLERPDAGRIMIGERDVTRAAPGARDLAMVFQAYALYPQMSVAANIGLGLEMRRLAAWQRLPLMRHLPDVRRVRASIEADVRAAADMVGMGAYLDRKPTQLSGGQRQRAALARAMVRKPQLLLMDEPLSNLDAKLRQKMRAEIAELHARTGATIVYVTHDQVEAMTLASEVAVMEGGRIVERGPPQRLYSDPGDVRVAEMLGSPAINLLAGETTSAGIVAGGLTWQITAPLPAGTPVRLGFRAERALPVAHEGAGPAATLKRTEHLGAESLLHLALPDGSAAIVRTDGVAAFAPGERIALEVTPEALLLFGADGRRVRLP